MKTSLIFIYGILSASIQKRNFRSSPVLIFHNRESIRRQSRKLHSINKMTDYFFLKLSICRNPSISGFFQLSLGLSHYCLMYWVGELEAEKPTGPSRVTKRISEEWQ